MFCPTCGNSIEEGAVYCRFCGSAAGQGHPGQAQGQLQGQVPSSYTDYYRSIPARADYSPVYSEGKSRVAAGILGILLGALGVHNFYLGYNGKGIAQLLITILSCGMLAAVSSIWGLVEGIMILTKGINCDAQGRPFID